MPLASLTSSYSYSSEIVSLKLLHRALIMRRVLTEPEKKEKLCTQLVAETYNQSVSQLLCISQLSTTELIYFRSKLTNVAFFT